MTIRRLERSEWTGFCVHASRGYIGKWVRIEVGSPLIGAQLEAQRVPLIGLTYDPKDDVLELIAGDLDHLIRAPRGLWVDEQPDGNLSLQVIDEDGAYQIVTLREPLMLPSPQYFSP